eukprot:6196232-Pleurochrysis_carterae.AAC.3
MDSGLVAPCKSFSACPTRALCGASDAATSSWSRSCCPVQSARVSTWCASVAINVSHAEHMCDETAQYYGPTMCMQ